MGYLTHVSIYNDGAHILKDMTPEEAQEFCQKLYEACLLTEEDVFRQTISLRFFSNAVNTQIPRHADDVCLYLHWGNSLICLDSRSIGKWARRGGNLLKAIKKVFEGEVSLVRRKVKEVTHHDSQPA